MDEHVTDVIEDFLQGRGSVPGDLPSPSWNIAPTQDVVVLAERLRDGERTRHAARARWSLVPPSSPTLKTPYPTFNARSETIAAKPSWRRAVAETRCLIPASGYYEWRGDGSAKTPFFIHSDEPVLLFAGLYSWWRAGANDPWTLTATIVTRAAVGPVATLHDRAPLVLPKEAQAAWIDPAVHADQAFVDAVSASATPTVERLRFHEVAPLSGDGPELARALTGDR